jgi:hypothetical protein
LGHCIDCATSTAINKSTNQQLNKSTNFLAERFQGSAGCLLLRPRFARALAAGEVLIRDPDLGGEWRVRRACLAGQAVLRHGAVAGLDALLQRRLPVRCR